MRCVSALICHRLLSLLVACATDGITHYLPLNYLLGHSKSCWHLFHNLDLHKILTTQQMKIIIGQITQLLQCPQCHHLIACHLGSRWAQQWAQLVADLTKDNTTAERLLVDILNEPDNYGIRWEAAGGKPGVYCLPLPLPPPRSLLSPLPLPSSPLTLHALAPSSLNPLTIPPPPPPPKLQPLSRTSAILIPSRCRLHALGCD